MKNIKRQYIEIIERGTEEVVHRVEVTGKSDRQIETIIAEIVRQMDLERYYAKEPA